MMAEVIQLARSRELEQSKRFRWRESAMAYWVDDTETKDSKFMGDGAGMFTPHEDDGEGLPLVPGTQQFYDALNMYFDNEQSEIGRTYFKCQ